MVCLKIYTSHTGECNSIDAHYSNVLIQTTDSVKYPDESQSPDDDYKDKVRNEDY